MNYPTGLYLCVSDTFIRREPYVIDNAKGGNRVAKVKIGEQRQILEIATNPDNPNSPVWGLVDEAGVDLWVCIKGPDKTYMHVVKADPTNAELASRLDELEARLIALEGKKSRKS